MHSCRLMKPGCASLSPDVACSSTAAPAPARRWRSARWPRWRRAGTPTPRIPLWVSSGCQGWRTPRSGPPSRRWRASCAREALGWLGCPECSRRGACEAAAASLPSRCTVDCAVFPLAAPSATSSPRPLQLGRTSSSCGACWARWPGERRAAPGRVPAGPAACCALLVPCFRSLESANPEPWPPFPAVPLSRPLQRRQGRRVCPRRL